MIFHARDPRATPRPVQHAPLAPRPALPSASALPGGKAITLIVSMPHGSGMEPLAAAVAIELQRRRPLARVQTINRGNGYMGDDPAQRACVVAASGAAVYFGSPTGALTAQGIAYAAELERAGVPCPVVIFETLANVAERARDVAGVAVRTVAVPYPPDPSGTEDAIGAIARALDAPLAAAEQRADLAPPAARPAIACSGDWQHVQDHFYAQGWSDGLPIVPPTPEAVAHMLTGTSHAAGEVVAAAMPPENWCATVEHVAIAAVMAGAQPLHLPALLALAEAFAAAGPDSLQVRSTNSFSYMQVVNGPARAELGMNGALNALGPGNRANALLGRALHLFIRTLGGGEVGTNVMAVQGNASAHSFAFAENEERSPWPPYSAAHGFGPGDSTLSLFNGGWSHAGNYLFDGLDQLAKAMARFELPTAGVVLASPQRAEQLARDGLTKEQAEEFVWSHATLPLSEFRESGYFGGSLITARIRASQTWPADYLEGDGAREVPVYPRGSIRIVVVGGDVAPMVQGWKMAHQATVSIDRWR